MSIAPALPPPTSLPPPTGAAPPGAPPGATPFHSALEEELARTAPAEGQHTEGHEKAREADAEAGNAPSRAHGRSGAKHGRPPTVVPALPGAAPTVPATAPPVPDEPPATTTPDTSEPAVAPPGLPAPVVAEAAPTGAPAETATHAPAAVEAPPASPLPVTTGSSADSAAPKPVSPRDGAPTPKSTTPTPAPAQPSSETPAAADEQLANDGNGSHEAPPASGEAGLGIRVSGRGTRATGISPRDIATGEDAGRTQAAGSPESSEAREAIAHVASATEPAEAPTATAHTATPETATPTAPAASATAAPSEPLVAPVQPAVAQAADSSPSGAPLPASGVGMQEMIESIHATIELAARQGVSQARIALQPAELGEIRIHLTQTGDGLLARVTAETPAAAEALAGARSELHQSLSTLGTSLLRLDINSFAQPEGRQGQGAGDASRQDSSRSGSTTGPEGSIDQLQATEASDATALATGPALGELVDVLA
jgi:flagellar hook-length control protein FliK